jgi:phosphohistidine phosphatase
MPILLVRHGEAVPAGEHGDDPRYLTERGREETRSVGALLRGEGLAPRAFVTSPLVRAVQTAELLAAALDHRGPVSADPGLVPDSPAAVIVRRIEAWHDGLLVVVCHEPIVRGIAALLVPTTKHPPFPTSGAALIGDGPGPRALIARFAP